ncbi:MAG: hypothetical protein J7498_08390 [Sphingobium sp.]|nr:hypothetical protein [Sphingobium sp.]
MRKSIIGLSAVSLLAIATPAFAEDAPATPIKITGSAALVSDYRFRGFSQNGENAAVQAGITLNHESGFYVGTWGSSINLKSSTNAQLSAEVDLFAGYTKAVAPGVTVDVGLLYYLYPKKGGGKTDFFEPYANVTGTVGPATVKVGVNYAWEQEALGKNSAIYLHAEPSIAIPGTPLSLDAHVGYADSKSALGGYGRDHHVWDYSIGGALAYKNLSLGVHYVNTDEARYRSGALAGLGAEDVGADGAVIFSLTASF